MDEENAVMISNPVKKRKRTRIGKDYKQVVNGIALVRKEIQSQTYARYCQVVAFVITAIGILAGVIVLAYLLEDSSKMVEEYSEPLEKLRPKLPEVQKTLGGIATFVDGADKAVNAIQDVTGGIANVLSGIKNNETSDVLTGLLNNATSAFEGVVNSVQDTGKQVGDSVLQAVQGNLTVPETVEVVGDSFQNLGNSIWDVTKRVGTDFIDASQSFFCGLFQSVCPTEKLKEENREDRRRILLSHMIDY